jgi:hypothetical protein
MRFRREREFRVSSSLHSTQKGTIRRGVAGVTPVQIGCVGRCRCKIVAASRLAQSKVRGLPPEVARTVAGGVRRVSEPPPVFVLEKETDPEGVAES